jgi:hypothetical protein
MKSVATFLVFFIISQAWADSVLLNNGQLLEGDVSWQDDKVQVAGKTVSISSVDALRIDKTLASEAGEFLVLKNGSLIKAQSKKLDSKKSVVIAAFNGVEKEIPLNLLRGISFNGSQFIGPSIKKGFILKGNKRAEGEVSYITRSIVGRSKPSKTRFKKSGLEYIVFNQEKVAAAIEVMTVQKEVYCGSLKSLKGKMLTLTYPLGEVEIPLSSIAEFKRLKTKKLLSESSISGVKAVPFLRSVKQPRFNLSFTGQKVTDNGRPLKSFLTLNSRTELTLNVPSGKYFSASAFIDPNVQNGDVLLTVLQNGKEVFKTDVRSSSAAIPISIQLRGRALTIIADFGGKGSIGDYLILANPAVGGAK